MNNGPNKSPDSNPNINQDAELQKDEIGEAMQTTTMPGIDDINVYASFDAEPQQVRNARGSYGELDGDANVLTETYNSGENFVAFYQESNTTELTTGTSDDSVQITMVFPSGDKIVGGDEGPTEGDKVLDGPTLNDNTLKYVDGARVTVYQYTEGSTEPVEVDDETTPGTDRIELPGKRTLCLAPGSKLADDDLLKMVG